MTYETKIHKGYDGWTAISKSELGETPEGTRVLELTTSKARGGLAASANVFIYKDQGTGFIYKDQGTGFVSKSTMIFGDFTKQGIAITPCSRVTEKAVSQVHARALLEMDDLIKEATAFYVEQDAKAA